MPLIPRIVLAPLAGGPSTPELAAAVCNAGGLGFLAGGYLAPEELADRIERTRALTDKPIGVNLFAVTEEPVDDAAVQRYAQELETEARALGVQLGEPRFDDDALDAKLDVVLDAQVDVVSLTFSFPAEVVRRLPNVWATVTSVREARTAHGLGAHALVVQGTEAGGHRGSWHDSDDETPLLQLLSDVAATVDLPLVAAGGITTSDRVAAAFDAGAVAVQAGTAFLLAPEAGTSEPHRRALAAGGETSLTRAFSGRNARGIVNRFMRDHPYAPSAYPHINNLTAPLRAAALAAGDEGGINLWAGVNFARTVARPAAETVAALSP
jgi:nitronate monooxygenase